MRNPLEKKIVFEDNHLLIINKDAGQLSQGDKTGDKTVGDIYKQYIKEKYKKPGNVFLHPVHRLDRPVSGLLILARTSKALSRMTTLFREQKILKTYIAISNFMPDKYAGQLTNFLEKNNTKNRVYVTEKPKKGKQSSKAILKYQVLSNMGGNTVFQVAPKTGKPHQIRVQLANIGCPIVGDGKYGGSRRSNMHQIGLHCLQMKFTHPVTKVLMTPSCDFTKNSSFAALEFNDIKDLLIDL